VRLQIAAQASAAAIEAVVVEILLVGSVIAPAPRPTLLAVGIVVRGLAQIGRAARRG